MHRDRLNIAPLGYRDHRSIEQMQLRLAGGYEKSQEIADKLREMRDADLVRAINDGWAVPPEPIPDVYPKSFRIAGGVLLGLIMAGLVLMFWFA